MNKYRRIDQKNWPRAAHCAIFRKQLIPTYSVAFELDVTAFRNYVKKSARSFTLSMMHVTAQCANGIENFRYRFLDGEVVLFEACSVNFVWLNPETELFKFVAVPWINDFDRFVNDAGKTAAGQTEYFVAPPTVDAFIFSPLPLVSYTAKSHTRSGDPAAASPIFDWGKFFERDGRWLMPFSVQVHHSFVDGIHIGRLVDSLQQKLFEFQGAI